MFNEKDFKNMHNVNTQQELIDAHIAICKMRGIDPNSTASKTSENLEIRAKIESYLEQIAIDNHDYELHGLNFTSSRSRNKLPDQSDK